MANQNQVQTQNQHQKTGVSAEQFLTGIQGMLTKELQKNMAALPENFNKQRFTLNCVAMMKDSINSWKGVDPNSIVTTLAKGAYLGLDFFNGECYAIPYSGQVQFQTDYKGEIKLAKKYSKNPIKDIYAKNVRQGDIFEEEIKDGVQTVNFKPVPFSNEPVIGTFAVVMFKDGSMIYDTMSVEEIEKVRDSFSKAKNSPAWTKTPGEMYKKTVLRRICKLIDLDFDNAQQDAAFQEGGDFDKEKASGKETVIEAEAVNVFDVQETEVPQEQPQQPQQEALAMDLEEV